MKSSVSIVVPIYNTEKYLDQCIQSVLAQTYTNWELLLIDDGSTDSSGAICDKYAAQDNRIRVFHKKNGGANSARKTGVGYVNGDYIMFVDSDDTITKNGLTDLQRYADQNFADIIVAHTAHTYKLLDKTTYLRDLLTGECWGSLCAKLYKTEFLKNNFCDIPRCLTMGEDLLQNINLTTSITRIIYCNLYLYNYRRNQISISNTFSRTWEYEKTYHSYVQEILQRDVFLNNSIPESEKNKVRFAWNRARLNGCRLIIMSGGEVNFQDPTYRTIRQYLRNFTSELSFEEKVLVYCPHLIMCKLILRAQRKMQHIKRR